MAIVNEKIKTDVTVLMNESAASDISVPADPPLYSGVLVIIASNVGYCSFAIVIADFSERRAAYIHDCITQKNYFYPTRLIRVLKFLPHIMMQPHLPRQVMSDYVCSLATQLPSYAEPFAQARIILPVSRIIVIGDLHGDANALRRILRRLYLRDLINKDGVLEPHAVLVCTGDINDRGPRGPELWRVFLGLKVRNPGSVFILRGNHEAEEAVSDGNFFEQMQACTGFSAELLKAFLRDLYSKLPCALLLGVAPQPRKDAYNSPYRFLLFCHGGIEPRVNLRYFLQEIVKRHKATSSDMYTTNLSYDVSRPCGLLWNDFRANISPEEPAKVVRSTRGPDIYLYNFSATEEFFNEHASAYPAHPYTLDAMVRGHQHIFGIGRLKNVSPSEETDWQMLCNMVPEVMPPASVYTCIASTRWVYGGMNKIESYGEIKFKEDSHLWEMTAHIAQGNAEQC
jgi:hypothetical protein